MTTVCLIIIIGLCFYLRKQIKARRKLQAEFTGIVFKAVHDMGSPLGALEMIAQSTSIIMPEDSRMMLRQVTIKIRDTIDTLLNQSEKMMPKSN